MRKIALLALLVLAGSLLISVPATADHLSDGLENYWPFDDDTADELAHGNDGTLQGGATFSASVPVWPGNVKSLSLDGTDDYVSVPDTDTGDGDLDGYTGLTIAGWISADDLTGVNGILTKYDTTAGNLQTSYYLGTDGDELRVFVRKDAGNYAYLTTDAANLGTGSWIHVAGTWDGSEFKLFVDGAEETSTLTTSGSFPDVMQNNDVDVEIGSFRADFTGARFGFWDGMLDELRLYDEALSSTEIAALADYSNFSVTSLSPDGEINMVGEEHTTTATISPALSFIPVSFATASGSANSASGTGWTDGSGLATFKYTGTSSGMDTIEAGTLSVLKYWVDLVSPVYNFCTGADPDQTWEGFAVEDGLLYSSHIHVDPATVPQNVCLYIANLGPGDVTFPNGDGSAGLPFAASYTPRGTAGTLDDLGFAGTFAEGEDFLGQVQFTALTFHKNTKIVNAHVDLSFTRDSVEYSVPIDIHFRQ